VAVIQPDPGIFGHKVHERLPGRRNNPLVHPSSTEAGSLLLNRN
jgi:hypothetical protein